MRAEIQRYAKYAGQAGLGLLILGTIAHEVTTDETVIPLALLVAGGILLAVSAAFNFRELIAITRRRSARHGANALLLAVFFTASLVIVQAISLRNSRHFDLTRNQRFTLAEQTLRLIETVRDDLNVTGFYRSGSAEIPRVMGLLDQYAQHNRHIRYEIIDPDQRPHVAQEMNARLGEAVVTYQDRSKTVKGIDEEKLTNAILQVTRERIKTVYFVGGHSEKDIADRSTSGYAAARVGLEAENYFVGTLSLLPIEQVPVDCAVLVLAGPRYEYVENEITMIRDYLAQGGSVLFMLDPQRDLPGVESLLRPFQLSLANAVVLDELVVDAGERMFDARTAKIRRYVAHPITRGFRAVTMFPMCAVVRVDDQTIDPRVSAQYLAFSEESAWGETDPESFERGQAVRDDTDFLGRQAVAAVASRDVAGHTRRRGRVVLFGDSDFAANSFFGVLGNGDLFLNSINFLAEQEDLIAVRPKPGLGDRVFITASQGRFVFALCIVLLPLSVLSVGTVIFSRRRNR